MSYEALLFCPDEKTARIVTQVLSELEFSVDLSNEPFATVKKLMARQYDAIVVDCDNEQNAALLFKSARNSTTNQASLAVAVVEGQAGVAKAFRIGANLVLTKPLNVEQSKGTLRVARGLLKKAETAKNNPGPSISPMASGTASMSFSTERNPIEAVRKTVSQAGKPATPASFRAAAASIAPPPTESSHAFDIDQDPTPALEPTEAAFLQSIADGAAVKSGSQAANNREVDPHTPSLATPVRHPFSFGSISGQATAAAPAKEKMKPAVEKTKPVQAPPAAANAANTKDTLAEPQFSVTSEPLSREPVFSAVAEAKRNNAPLIAIVVLLVLSGAAYFGWTQLRSNANEGTAPEIALHHSIQPPPPAVVSEQAPSQVTTEGEAKQSAHLPQLNQNPLPEAQESTTTKPDGDGIVVVENADQKPLKPAPLRKAAEPLSVRTDASSTDPSVAPPTLQSGGSATEQTIAGLITTTAAPVPKRSSDPIKISHGVNPGILIKRVNPVYPSQALQLRRQGAVEVLASITKYGTVANAKLLKGDPLLGAAAVTAVKQWKYQPYTLNGEPVEIQTQVSFNFKLPQ